MADGKKQNFGELLTQMIKEAGLTQFEFYTQLKIKKSYFYDILSGKVNPPPAEKQFAAIKILNPPAVARECFFDLAAEERHEVPADIAKFLKNPVERKLLRQRLDYNKMTFGENKDDFE